MIKTKTKGREGRAEMTLALTWTMRKKRRTTKRVQEKRREWHRRKREKDEIYKRDDHLRSTRSVNNTKADCGRG